jgi:hypothetical protein
MSTEVDALYSKIIELESRIEGQEQYSRRTSLRFHNIKVPVDERGNVKHPVNTMILLRTSGLVRASNTLSVIVFMVLGAFLGMMSVRSEIEFRRLICFFSCFSVAGRSSGLSSINRNCQQATTNNN